MKKSDYFVNEHGKLCVTDIEGTIVLFGVVLFEYKGRTELIFVTE